MKPIKYIIPALLSLATSLSHAAGYTIVELPDQVRFEQYTSGSLAIWRLPTPGVSVFPGGTCKVLIIPGTGEIANRFIAFYLYAKSNNRNYFVRYETSNCSMVSFGLDG